MCLYCYVKYQYSGYVGYVFVLLYQVSVIRICRLSVCIVMSSISNQYMLIICLYCYVKVSVIRICWLSVCIIV